MEGLKKLGKSGQADRLGWPPLPSPEAVRKMWKFLDKLPYLGLFCRFIKDKNGSKFSQIEAASQTAFSQFLFLRLPHIVERTNYDTT